MVFIMTMPVFMDDRHMNVKMCMFFIRQPVGTDHHQDGRQYKEYRHGVAEDNYGKQHTRQRSGSIQRAGARCAKTTHGIDEEHGAESIRDETEQENAQNGAERGKLLTKP